MQGPPNELGHAVDVEFLIAGPDRDVVVLQARPFRAVFHDAE